MPHYKTVAALVRAITRAGLLEVANAPEILFDARVGISGVGVAGVPARDVVHTSWLRCEPTSFQRGGTVVELSLAELQAATVCPSCAPDLAELAGHGPGLTLRSLLEADLDAASAARAIAQNRLADGKSVKLTQRLRDHLRTLERLCGPTSSDAVQAAREAIEDRVNAALEGLSSPAFQSARREPVAARVRDELTPDRFKGILTYDESPTLVSILGSPRFPRKVLEVVTAFTVHDADRGKQVLRCPRYVVDHINRFAALGNTTQFAMTTMSDPGISDADLEVAYRLWDPSGGPLSSLDAAIDAARLVTMETRPS